MPPRHAPSDRTRSMIASTAARLIAEDGVTDYAFAKRKALRELGLPETSPLPNNAEVEDAVRSHQAVFQDDEQQERLQHLRRKAIQLMDILEPFSPYLTGSVLDGTAARYAAIDLQLFADSAKDVEIFLLNRNIPFDHAKPRNDRAEAVLVVDSPDASANLVIYPLIDERTHFKAKDGRQRERARIDAVRALLTDEAS